MRRVLLAFVTLIAVCVVIPLSVLVTARAGIGATHWTGVVLSDARWGGSPYTSFPPQYARNLGAIADLNAHHPDDLAGYTYDGELVAFAATDEGEKLIRAALRGYPYAWTVVRVDYSTRQLHAEQERISADDRGLLRTTPIRVIQVGMSAEGNCVELTAIRLDHDLFTRLKDFSDVACVAYDPSAPLATADVGSIDGSRRQAAVAEPTRDLPGTYFVLLTGFPWHIAGTLLIAGLLWLRPWRWRRAKRAQAAEVTADE